MEPNVNAALKSLVVPLDKLHLDPNNARQHDERSLTAISNSLREYGQQKPIITLDNGTVIAGNGTLEAAKRLGWSGIATVRFSDEAKARAFAVADNRTAELSVWNDTVLARTLDELSKNLPDFDPELVGFSETELMKLLATANPGEVIDNVPLETVKPTAQTDLLEPQAPSHVRMVQLFLDSESQPVFMEQVKALAAKYGTTTVTDTVIRAVAAQVEDASQNTAA